MTKKNEVIEQKMSELIATDEQQFYEDVRFILQQAREQAYNSANLRNCRQFYLVFPEDSYGFSIAGKIP